MNQAYKEQEARRYDEKINASLRAIFAERVKRLVAAKQQVMAAAEALKPLRVSNGYGDDYMGYDGNYASILSDLWSLERKIDGDIDFLKRASSTYYNNMAASHWGENIDQIDEILDSLLTSGK